MGSNLAVGLPCWSNRWLISSWEFCPQISVIVVNSTKAAIKVKRAGFVFSETVMLHAVLLNTVC